MPWSGISITIETVKLWRQWSHPHFRRYDTCFTYSIYSILNVSFYKRSGNQKFLRIENQPYRYSFCVCFWSVKLLWLFNMRLLNLFQDQSVQILPHLKRLFRINWLGPREIQTMMLTYLAFESEDRHPQFREQLRRKRK